MARLTVPCSPSPCEQTEGCVSSQTTGEDRCSRSRGLEGALLQDKIRWLSGPRPKSSASLQISASIAESLAWQLQGLLATLKIAVLFAYRVEAD